MRLLIAGLLLASTSMAIADPPLMHPGEHAGSAGQASGSATVPLEMIKRIQAQSERQNRATIEKLLGEVQDGIKAQAEEDDTKDKLAAVEARLTDTEKQLAEQQTRTNDVLKQLGDANAKLAAANAKLAAKPATDVQPEPPPGYTMLLECPAQPTCYSSAPVEANTVELPAVAIPKK